MKIGYACLCNGLPEAQIKTCNLKSASPERLEAIVQHNLDILERILYYNKCADILMFRISSDIIPFASHAEIQFDWKTLFADKLCRIGAQAKRWDMRLSMHPGQYTVLNSPDADVVARAVLDLQYHADFLDALGLDSTHKLILHIGGVYGDKPAAIARFCKAYKGLGGGIKRRLVIENDDRLYTAQDVFAIAQAEGIPAVFDTLHDAVLPSAQTKTQAEWISAYASTWHKEDGEQKIHFAQQQPGKKPGSHSDTIAAAPFAQFYHMLEENSLTPDIMLEVKDKDISAHKCIACVRQNAGGQRVLAQWEKYRYAALERGAEALDTLESAAGLDMEDERNRTAFFTLLESVMSQWPAHAEQLWAAQAVWSELAGYADEKQKREFARRYADAQKEEKKTRVLGRFLMRAALEHLPETLAQSYYFLQYK